MKKAAIITFSAADNFGALMQCYALRKAVENRGYDVSVIHYWPGYLRSDYRLMFNREELRAGWKSGLKCLWRSVIYIRFHNLPKAVHKRYKMQQFRKRYLHITDKCKTFRQLSRLAPVDLYITGSDQVWNAELTGGRLDPAFFLMFAPKGAKKVSYAASTGSTPDREAAMEFVPYLKELDRISVRESRTASVLQEVMGREVCQDKDPTLLLTREQWEELLPEQKESSEYILFFSLYYRPEQFEYVNRLSEELHLPIKHYFYGRLAKRLTQNGGTCFFDSPQELLGRIKNAAYVVTDSFHATVFSIIFEKRFATFPSGKWSERMEELLRQYHLEDHYIRSEE